MSHPLVIILVICGFISGIATQGAIAKYPKAPPGNPTVKQGVVVNIWTDPKYHCDYVVTVQGGIYPRLGAECADQNEVE